MPGSNDTLRYSIAKVSSLGNYTQTAANFNWNFSSLELTGQGIRDFKKASNTPYALFFFGINEYGEKIADTLGVGPVIMTNYYNYYKKQTLPSAFIADGVGLTYNSFPIPNYYSDKDELYLFPMTYPKYDSTTFKFTTASNTNIPVKYSKTGYRVTVVDGWGTITTPFGTSNCLRLITTQYSKDSVKTSFGTFGFPNDQRSYQWMTTSSKIPFLEISGSLNGNTFNPALVRYRDSVRVITSLKSHKDLSDMKLYPNPVRENLFLIFNSHNKFDVEVYSVEGSLIQAQLGLTPVNLKGDIHLSGLTPGLYVIKVTQNNSHHFLKFIKE